MTRIIQLVFGTFIGLSLASQVAIAKKNDGIVIVGTQTEVLKILEGSSLKPTFSENSPNAMVAVRLSKDTMSIYEGESVNDLLKLIGKVVAGGVAITVHVGTELWKLLNDLGHLTINVGGAALKAACKILCDAACLIVDGATWAVKTSLEVLAFVGELINQLIGIPLP